MNFKLVTLLGIKINQEVYEVMIPTSEGEIAVYPDHEPLVALAVPGVVAIRHHKDDGNEKLQYFAISGGLIKITHKTIQLLVDEADHGDDIVEAESKAAYERAVQMRKDAKDQVELDKAHELVDRHAVRLKVAELRRRHRG